MIGTGIRSENNLVCLISLTAGTYILGLFFKTLLNYYIVRAEPNHSSANGVGFAKGAERPLILSDDT